MEKALNQNRNLVTLLLSSLATASLCLSTGVLAGCVGDTPGAMNNDPDAGGGATPDAAPGAPDAGEIAPTSYKVSGMVMDYFAGNIGTPTAVSNAALATQGLAPPVSMTADALGAYSMDILPASLFFVTVTASGYAPSLNAPTQVLDADVVRNQVAASLTGIARQYAGAGAIEIIAGNGIVMIELQRNNGQPAIDVPLANIVLATLAAPEVPVGIPYLVDPLTTDLSPNDVTLVSAVDGQGTARAGFLNIAPGEYTLTVTIPPGGGGGGGGGDGDIQTVLVTVSADGATFAVSSAGAMGGGGGGGGGGTPAIVLDPNVQLGFTEDIYPLLQTVAMGGDGCATCHDALHILPFIGTPEETLALLNLDAIDPAGVPRINLLSPAESPFVMNPVYEAIPNHPNAFWTVNSNHYIGTVAWITQGAALLRADAVLPVEPPVVPPPE